LNGIQEVSGSIPLGSTKFLPAEAPRNMSLKDVGPVSR